MCRVMKLGFIIVKMSIGIVLAQGVKTDCRSNYKRALKLIKEVRNIEEKVKESIALLTPCAEKGDTNAQTVLGRIYLSLARRKNHEQGFELIKKAAESGNVNAAIDLGILYKYGKGCKQNFHKSRFWFDKASNNGGNMNTYNLSRIFVLKKRLVVL